MNGAMREMNCGFKRHQVFLDSSFQYWHSACMARPKEFDQDVALDAAIGVFREHGYAATSAGMLTAAMKIGRQSLYDTFGDKWRLYCQALQRYSGHETEAHLAALEHGSTAIDGLRQLVARVVSEARQPCLGVGSVNEFGNSRADLNVLRASSGQRLRKALTAKIRAAQQDGDLDAPLAPEHGAAFLLANVAAIRIAARGGADDAELKVLGQLALKALLP
jgi:TetR/AcrR family transcriptional repressor of nem operon